MQRGSEKFWRSLPGSGKTIICKCRIWSNKHIIGDPYPVPQLHTTFDRNAITDDDVILDEDVIADIAIPTNYRPR
jgi:hypothetical protein